MVVLQSSCFVCVRVFICYCPLLRCHLSSVGCSIVCLSSSVCVGVLHLYLLFFSGGACLRYPARTRPGRWATCAIFIFCLRLCLLHLRLIKNFIVESISASRCLASLLHFSVRWSVQLHRSLCVYRGQLRVICNRHHEVCPLCYVSVHLVTQRLAHFGPSGSANSW